MQRFHANQTCSNRPLRALFAQKYFDRRYIVIFRLGSPSITSISFIFATILHSTTNTQLRILIELNRLVRRRRHVVTRHAQTIRAARRRLDLSIEFSERASHRPSTPRGVRRVRTSACSRHESVVTSEFESATNGASRARNSTVARAERWRARNNSVDATARVDTPRSYSCAARCVAKHEG